jgi:hypothetical protein
VDLEKEQQICLLDLKELLPGFEEHAEIILLQYFKDDWPVYRRWPGYGVPEKTSIVNLYAVGDSVLIPGLIGTSNSAQSAVNVVEDIKHRIK